MGAADLDLGLPEVLASDLRSGDGGGGSSLFGGGAEDFPTASWWAPAIQGLGSLGSGASTAAPASSSLLDTRGLQCNFLFVLDLSVRSWIWL